MTAATPTAPATPALLPPAHTVLVFALYVPRPTFHRRGAHATPPPPAERVAGRRITMANRTRCGREWAWHSWTVDPADVRKSVAGSHKSDELATLLRFDHARAIGRPCRRCFPEATA